ncbi:MAG: hypothetical protein AAGH89_12755, partial [Verrucomicrobiota bacterium]
CSHLLEQVQEVCDRVGIMSQGRMVREGPLEELTKVEGQEELVLEGANQKLLAEIRSLIDKDKKATVVRSGKPRTSLERLFLDATNAQDAPEQDSSDPT